MNNIDNNLQKLKLDDDIIELLQNNNIITLNDLWNLKRKELKTLGLKDSQIKKVMIELQLNGLDLNKKHNGRDIANKR